MIGLAQPNYRNVIVTEKGYNNDIIQTLNSRFSQAVDQTKNVTFSGNSLYEKGRAIYNYLRNSVAYKKDDAGKQIIQLPSRLILDTKQGDCKSKALAAAAFMYNNGFSNVRLRYSSYSATNNTPTHVYAVGSDTLGNDIIIDPVFKKYNAEVPYTNKQDYKMQISVLSGPPALIKTQSQLVNIPKKNAIELAKKIVKSGKIKAGTLAIVALKNFIARSENGPFISYSDDQLRKYQNLLIKRLPTIKNSFIKMIFQNEIDKIQNNTWRGILSNSLQNESAEITGLREDIEIGFLKKIRKKLKKVSLKKIVRGVKTVGLIVPRKSFLAMVALNVRGIATRLSKLSDSEIKKLWVNRFGGKFSVLQSAIKKGSKKRPLFGASKKIKAIKGIGYIVDDNSSDIGAIDAATAGVIVAAAPILVAFIRLLKRKGIPEDNAGAGGGVPGESGDFPEAEGMAQDQKSNLNQWVDTAVDVAKATGLIPDKPLTANEQQVNDAIPGDDYTNVEQEGTKFKINPVILIGGAAAAFLLLRKK